MDKILEHTGLRPQTENSEFDPGKWFECDNKGLPSFLSNSSYQGGNMERKMGGWENIKPSIYPDRWIHPEDSVILTINASELIPSNDFSAGVTLRFPRILGEPRYDKPCDQVETTTSLQQIYATKKFTGGSTKESTVKGLLFRSSTKKPKGKRITKKSVVANNLLGDHLTSIEKKTRAFDALTFVVFEGSYERSILKRFKSRFTPSIGSCNELRLFIRQHGGKVLVEDSPKTNFLVGGSRKDPRINIYSKAINKPKSESQIKNSDLADKYDTSVMHWLFIIKLYLRWLDEVLPANSDESFDEQILLNEKSIIESFEHLLIPERTDFLVLSPKSEKALVDREVASRINGSTVKCLLRAVEKTSNENLQAKLYSALEYDEALWVLGGKRKRFWPYQIPYNTEGKRTFRDKIFPFRVVVYIDACEWSQTEMLDRKSLNPLIPLIEIMGGTVTESIDGNVTHILTDILGEKSKKMSLEAFRSMQSGMEETSRTQCATWHKLFESKCPKMIQLISPEWLYDLYENESIFV